MPVDLSVKRVSDELANRLRDRAKRNHRSLQGELLAILESAVVEGEQVQNRGGWIARERGTTATLPAAPGWRIAPPSESAMMIREDRDGRTSTVRDLYAFVSTFGKGTPDESAQWIREDRSSVPIARRPSSRQVKPTKRVRR